MRKTTLLRRAVFFILLLVSGDLFAVRYSLVPLDVSNAIVINSANKVIGTDMSGNPVVIEKGTIDVNDPTDKFYDTEDTTILTLTGLDAVTVHIVDINSTNNDPASERIIGWYEDTNSKRHSVIWKKEDGVYTYEVLPNYERTQLICSGNIEKDTPDCIAKEDIKTEKSKIDNTISCDNAIWDDWTETDPLPAIGLITECDLENEVVGMNQNGTIIGTSYRNESCASRTQCERPIVWTQTEEETDDENVDPLVSYSARDIGVFYINQERTSFYGHTTKIDRLGSIITGVLYEETAARYLPAVWYELGTEQGGQVLVEITKGGKDDIYTNINGVGVSSITSSQITGWYDSGDALIRPVSWRRSINAAGQSIFVATDIPTLDGNGNGQVSQSTTSGGHIGSSGTDPNDYTAFISTKECGVQNINDLLATPNDNLKLNTGLSTSSETFSDSLLVSGTIIDTTAKAFYVLRPEPKQVKLGVNIVSNHQELIVGEDHTYTIILTNNGEKTEPDTGNYATCINIDILPYVDIPRGDNTSYTKSGGLSILKAEITGNSSICTWTPASVNCFVPRLNPGASVTISLLTKPRPILAGRTIKMTAEATSSETGPLPASTPEELETGKDTCSNPPLNEQISVTCTQVSRQGCFIATAAYGSYLAPHVQTLRKFRDDILLQFPAGKWLVTQYYTYSPDMAELIENNDTLKQFTRALLLPLVLSVKYPLLLLCLPLFIAFLYFMKRNQRRFIHA